MRLPRNQLFVTRVSPRTPLRDLLRTICNEKTLDFAKYELRHPGKLTFLHDFCTIFARFLPDFSRCSSFFVVISMNSRHLSHFYIVSTSFSFFSIDFRLFGHFFAIFCHFLPFFPIFFPIAPKFLYRFRYLLIFSRFLPFPFHYNFFAIFHIFFIFLIDSSVFFLIF